MYNELVQIVANEENTNGMPLFVAGIFFNTSRDINGNVECLDVESIGIDGKQEYIFDDADLKDFLTACNVALTIDKGTISAERIE